jgi:hypothetical protein
VVVLVVALTWGPLTIGLLGAKLDVIFVELTTIRFPCAQFFDDDFAISV